MGNKALLVVDMLNDFLYKEFNPGLACDRGIPIIPNIKKVADAAVAGDNIVVYCSDAHLPEDTEFARWPPHAMQGTPGSQIIPQLPTDGMYAIKRNEKFDPQKAKGAKIFNVEKGTYSGFYDTQLDEVLRFRNVDTVYITGLHTNMCDTHTAAGAFFKGYKIVLVKDAVQAFSDFDHENGMRYIEFTYAAKLKTTDEAMMDFARGRRK